jgi:toxin ParE1/3/4
VRYVVELSKAAKSDLIEITQQIALDNPSAALKLFNLVKVRCASLDQLPERGKRVLFNGQSFRHVFVGNYIIRYQIVEKTVLVIRIVDGRRDQSEVWD